MARFYRERASRPAWTGRDDAALRELRAAIASAAQHGLAPEDYHAGALARAVDAGDITAIELLATDAYVTLGAHLLRGKLDAVSVEPNWTASRRAGDVIAQLAHALESGRVRDSLDALAPNVRAYRTLQAALRTFSESAASSDWRTIPGGPTLKPGMQGPRVAALRARLAAEGILAAANPADTFDPATEEAVAAFQRRIGLEADGVVGPLTLHELNRRPAGRIAQIRANLERWRWLAEELGRRHIRVNIPEFRLEAWEDGKPVRAHDVIVGRAYRKTPVFSDRISFVVFNPWWETPHNIARLDKLPEFAADPGLVDRMGYEVLDAGGRKLDPSAIDWRRYSAREFPFRLRQRPGPLNALGRVKLMFPNAHNVYLHDTPTQELFRRSRRDFSSGCIRVHGAVDLTEWVLRETDGWNRERIEQTIASGRETQVNLAARVPVHLLYMTVVAAADGSVRFLPDVYDRDARVIAALARPSAGR